MSSVAASSASSPSVALPISLPAQIVCSALAQMPAGRLELELPDGARRCFGAEQGSTMEIAPGIRSHASIRVRREAFFWKCFLQGDIGFAESFIDGDWDTPDLAAVIGWFVRNHEHAPTLSGSRARSWAWR